MRTNLEYFSRVELLTAGMQPSSEQMYQKCQNDLPKVLNCLADFGGDCAQFFVQYWNNVRHTV